MNNNVSQVSITHAVLVEADAVSPHATPLQLSLFNTDGEPVTPLSAESNQMPVQAASTAADVATLKTDFNALLTKLKNAGLMATS